MIRKLVLISSLFLFHSFIGFSQIPNLKAGFNLSTITGPGNKFQPGFYMGISTMKSLKDNLSFKAEMVYSLQGAKSIENNRAFYSYINLPLLLSFDVGNHLYFDVGPQCGLMFNGTIKTGTSKSFVTPDLTTLDLALCIGLGVKLDKFLIWETRCNYGVTNISRYSQSPDVLRNVVIQTGLLLKLEKHDNENN